MQPESSAARICGQQRQRIRGKASKTGFPGRARKTEKMPSQRGGTLSNHLVPHIHTLDLAGKNAPAARGHPLKPSCTSHSCSRSCRKKCPRSAGAPPQTILYLTFMLSILPEKVPPAARGHPLKPSCTSHSCSRSCRKKCPRSAGAPSQTLLYLTFMLSILPEKMPPQRGGTPSNHLVPHIHALDLASKNAPAARGHPLKPSCTSHSCSRSCRQKCPPQRGGTLSNPLVPHIHTLDLAGDVGVVDQGAAKIVAVFGKGDIHPRG